MFISEFLPNLALGFATAFSLINLWYCFIGVLVGTLIGVLPGIGPVAAVAMLMPLTFKLDPVGGIIMMAGIYYGSQYGGSTTSILVNLPGESSSVVTCLDGYQMAKQGRAGPALAIAAVGSFFAGTVGTCVVALLGPSLAEIALKFGPAEYFSLLLMAMISAAVLSQGAIFKSMATIVLGMVLGIVGTDVNTGVSRFTFGVPILADGLNFAMLAMGLFGFAEILSNLGDKADTAERDILSKRITGLMPTWQDMKVSARAILRGIGIGIFFGTLPGGGPTVSSFTAYAVEKKVAKDPSRFGKGAIEGVAAPESANNAASQCSFITTLTLGIPHGATMALLLGALTIHGIQPGPQVMTQRPDLFWGLICSMWIGNFMLLLLNLPLIGLWVKLLQVPYRFLFPAIIGFMAIGIYSVNNMSLDIYMAIVFGILGYIFMKLKCSPAPLILAFLLGPMVEENLRRALLISRGDPKIFIMRPISAGFLIAAFVLLAVMLVPAIHKRREEATSQGEVL